MKGFILANGHSGTAWAAEALTLCTDLTARHESWHHGIGPDFGGVESNGNLWNRCEELEVMFPAAKRIHLVRDGRKVVRTIMFRKQASFFRQACRRWNNRNERLALDVCSSHRFRLEDLTTDWRAFRTFAERAGALEVNQRKWEGIRTVMVNASGERLHGKWPTHEEWTSEQGDVFWETCGVMMNILGYGERP